MNLQWMEAALPLGIIAVMLNIMGFSQYYCHKAVHGRPKQVRKDRWDFAVERRDKRIQEALEAYRTSKQ